MKTMSDRTNEAMGHVSDVVKEQGDKMDNRDFVLLLFGMACIMLAAMFDQLVERLDKKGKE